MSSGWRRDLRSGLRGGGPRAPRSGLRGGGPRVPRSGLRSPREEMAEATAHGQVYLRRLRRAQLTLSLLALVAFGALFGVMPLAFFLLPRLQRVMVLGVPITVWLMIVPMLPLFLAIGWLYVRRADALDDAFRDLVER